ncbi:hypothetical protein M569_02263, partial [Genlisea aurea]
MALARGKWVKLDQKGSGPGARSSHAVAIVGDKVYAFGGEFIPRVPVDNRLYIFDINEETWSIADAKGDIPPPRVGVSMAAIGDAVFVFGGRDAEHKELNELYLFDTISSTWTLLPSGPPHRSYHSMAADDRRLYIFGGCGNSGRLNDLWGYDVVDKKWIEFPSPGEGVKPRGGAGLSVVAGKIWVVYGFSGMELKDVHCFDPVEGKWCEVETGGDEKPSGRSVFSTFSYGDSILIYGGEIDPSDLGHLGAGKFADGVYGLNTRSLVWNKLEEGEESVGRPGARGWCAFGGGRKGLLIYGGNSPSNDRLGDMFLFRP